MLKALSGLLVAGVAALTIASPAAAAPVCHDDTVSAVYSGSGYGAYSLDSWNFCDGAYDIVSVDWSLGPWYVYWVGPASVYLDGLYYGTETAVVTVSDGTDTAQFTLTVM